MNENLDPNLAELLEDVDSTYKALADALRSYLYLESLMPAVYIAGMFGEGSDVSPWEMGLEDIHLLMTDRLTRRSVDIWDNSKACNDTLEEFCQHLENGKPKVSAGRGTWCLEYLIWAAYHKHPSLDEDRKGRLRELYRRVWEVVSSAEYAKHVKIRNKHLAHLGRDIPLRGREHQNLLPDNDLWMLASWTNRAFKIFAELLEICGMSTSYPIELSHDLLRRQIAQGTHPIAEQYSHIVKQRRGNLERVSPRPTVAESLTNSHITWQAKDGSLYYADKLQENKWHLYKKASLGGIHAKQILAEGITALHMKDAAEEIVAGRGDTDKNMPLSFEAKSLAEMFRTAISDAAEIQEYKAGLLIVASELEWDGYIGITTPVLILFIANGPDISPALYTAARALSEPLRQYGVTVAIRQISEEEYAESLPIPATMLDEENYGRCLNLFPFAGDIPENQLENISLEGQTGRKDIGHRFIHINEPTTQTSSQEGTTSASKLL